MPETPEAHKEIFEIKREVREIRQTQDAQIFLDRQRLEDHLFKLLDDNSRLMKVLLAIDGFKSAKEIERECSLPTMTCWRMLDKLQKEGIVTKLEETKKGSPVFVKARWYAVLRLDEKVQKRLTLRESLTQQVMEQDDDKRQVQP